MIVNVSGIPVHPLADGVTVIVATIGVTPPFVAVKDGMLPDPLTASPIAALLLVHVKVVPVTGLVKLIGRVVALLQ